MNKLPNKCLPNGGKDVDHRMQSRRAADQAAFEAPISWSTAGRCARSRMHRELIQHVSPRLRSSKKVKRLPSRAPVKTRRLSLRNDAQALEAHTRGGTLACFLPRARAQGCFD